MHAPPFVLLLEDDLDQTTVLLMALRGSGFRAECASDGSTMLTRVFSELPDLVLADVSVPRINGALLGKAMRSDPRTAATPLVFQSATPEIEIKRHFADYDAYFFKPIDLFRLISTIRRLTDRQ